jgi:hypothetical protein
MGYTRRLSALKIALNKCDLIRAGCVGMMKAARDEQIATLTKLGKTDLAKALSTAPYNAVMGCVIADSHLAGKYSDEQAIKLQMYSLVADGECPPFVFQDKELVKNILESRLGKIPMECLKLPYNTFMIEMPELVEFPDGSKDLWDIAVVMNIEGSARPKDNSVEAIVESMNQTGGRKMACTFLNSQTGIMNWFHFPIEEVAIIDDGTLFDANGEVVKDQPDFKAKTVSDAMLMLAKIVFFITSPSCTTEVEKRPKPSASMAYKDRHYHLRVHHIKMNKEAVKRYEYEESGGSGRVVTVRHRVIGHFKHFTKGPLSGKVLWCPPHWRGPEVGTVIDQVHVI